MRVKKKKKAWKKWLLAAFLVIGSAVAAAGVYIAVQYNSGLSAAEDGPYKDDGKTFEPFQASEPETGKVGDMNILLLGSDTRGEDRGNSDTLMIAHYSQSSRMIKLASIMRDTYVEIPGHGMQKINAAFAFGGPELVRKTVKENFGIDVQYYAVVDFEGFRKIVDIIAPAGIEVDIPYEMSYGIDMTLEPGKQRLHGDELLGYVRFRHDRQSDFGRVERQQEVMSKLKEEALSVNSLVQLPKMIGVADPYIETNIGSKTMLALGKGLFSARGKDVETIRIPLEGSFVDARTEAGLVLRIDEEENREALKEFFSTGE